MYKDKQSNRGRTPIFYNNTDNSGSAVEIRLIGNELESDLVKKFLLKVLPKPIDTGDRKERETNRWRRYLVLPDDNVSELFKEESEEIVRDNSED